ncbi:hypothetical protein [Draconibacterium halophilum]|uniref:Uncharacterized protein n=1 Tax=Draconibacterium halophilum TaxID=2706887 RepID=A0A6C0RIA7_9BACT|nr:hypothetical protein [Draconibacterium halophilum]QIA09859.1 hypothetical protein G0Q07_20100 [Draconibacterium halophilum]
MVDDFSMHRFKPSVMVRMGYRWINVFASYDLVPLFKTDKGQNLHLYFWYNFTATINNNKLNLKQ